MAQFQFARLLLLAREEEERAIRVMQNEQRRLQHSEQKLEQLFHFRGEYQERLRLGQQTGMPIDTMQDYLRFMAKLDVAISQQQSEVERCQMFLSNARAAWEAKQQRVKAFEKLQQRHDQQENQKTAKREQKLMDEFASRDRSPFSHDRAKPK